MFCHAPSPIEGCGVMGEVLVRLGMPPAVPASPDAPKPREQYQRLAEQGQASDVIIARDTYKQSRKELLLIQKPMLWLYSQGHLWSFCERADTKVALVYITCNLDSKGASCPVDGTSPHTHQHCCPNLRLQQLRRDVAVQFLTSISMSKANCKIFIWSIFSKTL